MSLFFFKGFYFVVIYIAMNSKGIQINDVLSIIAAKKPTGILTLETDIHLGTLTFKDGLLIGAQSPYGHKLGDIILTRAR